MRPRDAGQRDCSISNTPDTATSRATGGGQASWILLVAALSARRRR